MAVPDTLSQGGDREPSPWPRRVATAAVVVLAAVLIVVHLPRSGHSPARSARASATASAPPAAAGAAPPAAAGVPDGITGPSLSWPGALRLPAAGPRPTWFLPGTGQMVPIGGLPAYRSGYEFTRAAGGWAIQASPGGQSGCGACALPPRPVYFLADGARSVTRVGSADAVAPAAAGALWLTSYALGADPASAAGTAREVSTDGAPLGSPVKLPAGYQIEQATDGGLLLAPADLLTSSVVYRLWDPVTARTSWTFDSVLAANSTQIAWAPACAARCGVRVTNLVTGRQVTADMPGGRSPVNAAFSPDGRYLAVETSFSNEGDDGGQAVQLGLVSTATGGLTAIPGTWLSSDALISFGWPASGDSLVAELGFTTKVQLMSWHPGATRLAVAAISPGQSLTSLAIGQYAA